MRPQIRIYPAETVMLFAGALPEEHFEILLAAADDLTYAQIAEKKGLKIGTVKSRLNRARANLEKLKSGPLHDNGAPKFAIDGTLLDRDGNRSIFDDVDQ